VAQVHLVLVGKGQARVMVRDKQQLTGPHQARHPVQAADKVRAPVVHVRAAAE
jgi:hypothetical protein